MKKHHSSHFACCSACTGRRPRSGVEYLLARYAVIAALSPMTLEIGDSLEAAVRSLVAKHMTERLFGLLGEPTVNVLELNLDLDSVSR